MRDSWRGTLSRAATRLRNDGRSALLWSMRITVAAVASYVVAQLFFPGTKPLLAPLTAMLVVQVTPVSLLASGLDRVVAVVSGVFLAVAFAAVLPLTWWSLGLLIFASITIGQALRLRSNLIEVAISGMLVLGVGSFSAEAFAWQRVAETLVGAAVGIAANLLFPPKVASSDAGKAIDGLADSLSDLLNHAADELDDLADEAGDVLGPAKAWLGDARQVTHDIPRVGAALLHAEQGRRLNVRAVGTPDVSPGLRQGLEALEHCAVAVRSMFRALVDAAADPSWGEGEGYDEVLRRLARTFRAMAAGVDAFGQLVHDEADPLMQLTAADAQTLREALTGLQEARAGLEEVLAAGTGPRLLELHVTVLTTTKRLLREMDLDERIRRQVQLRPRRRPTRPRPPATGQPRGPGEPSPEDETTVLPRIPRERRGPGD